jgi:site-specific DNA-methyltransferase (adenine-specific)
LYPAHYALLYYTKGDPNAFTRPKIPKAICAKCKKDLRDYGGYKKFVADGINLSDIWDDVSPVRHRRTKTRTANELPIIIPERVVTISGVKNGLFVDPFAGSGTTVLAAMSAGMRFVACDSETEYCSLMSQRISQRAAE